MMKLNDDDWMMKPTMIYTLLLEALSIFTKVPMI